MIEVSRQLLRQLNTKLIELAFVDGTKKAIILCQLQSIADRMFHRLQNKGSTEGNLRRIQESRWR
ncbi:hypothetical protein D3C71_2146560 [compost metagenome]